MTPTNKVVKASLRDERWSSTDAVWYRPGRDIEYRPLTQDDVDAIEKEMAAHG